jgi:hypothetical protein
MSKHRRGEERLFISLYFFAVFMLSVVNCDDLFDDLFDNVDDSSVKTGALPALVNLL